MLRFTVVFLTRSGLSTHAVERLENDIAVLSVKSLRAVGSRDTNKGGALRELRRK